MAETPRFRRLVVTWMLWDGREQTISLGDGEHPWVDANIDIEFGERETPSEGWWRTFEHTGTAKVTLSARGPLTPPEAAHD